MENVRNEAMTRLQIKVELPLVASIIWGRAGGFMSHYFKVIGDREFLTKLFKNGDINNLKYMEEFYRGMIKADRRCERDVFSKEYTKLRPLYKVNRKKKDIFEE
jgi:hypothetical protein